MGVGEGVAFGFSVKVPSLDLLGGSGVGIRGVKSPLLWVITLVILLITLLITNHEPPSRGLNCAPAPKALRRTTTSPCAGCMSLSKNCAPGRRRRRIPVPEGMRARSRWERAVPEL